MDASLREYENVGDLNYFKKSGMKRAEGKFSRLKIRMNRDPEKEFSL